MDWCATLNDEPLVPGLYTVFYHYPPLQNGDERNGRAIGFLIIDSIGNISFSRAGCDASSNLPDTNPEFPDLGICPNEETGSFNGDDSKSGCGEEIFRVEAEFALIGPGIGGPDDDIDGPGVIQENNNNNNMKL